MTNTQIINSFSRIFWALAMSCMFGFYYARAWGLEHGNDFSAQDRLFGRDKRGKETCVMGVTLAFPAAILILLTVSIGKMGLSGGLASFFSFTADFMFSTSVYYVLLLMLMPVLRRYVSARACAETWLLPLFFYFVSSLFPAAPSSLRFVLYIPQQLLHMFLPVWGIGFVIIFSGFILSHLIFRHRILKAAYDETDAHVLEIWKQESDRLAYRLPVRLMRCSAARTPFSMGNTGKTRVTILPVQPYTGKELAFIFRHELRHIQRRDADSRLFFAFAASLLWFHPFVWVAVRQAGCDLELSCDEIVLDEADAADRKFYAELLLNTAGERRGFTTCLSASAGALRYRLRSVVKPRMQSPGTLLLMLLAFCSMISFGSFAVSTGRTTIGDELPAGSLNCDYALYTSAGGTSYRGTASPDYDEQALLSYISSLSIERLTGTKNYTAMMDDAPMLSIFLSPAADYSISVCGGCVTFYDWNEDRSTFYYLRDTIDWAKIKACFCTPHLPDHNLSSTLHDRIPADDLSHAIHRDRP